MSQINAENKAIWNANADYWNAKMGTVGNDWHLELIAPSTIQLLDLKPAARLLDIGCGNGLFARRMQAKGIQMTAFDFAEQNIKNALAYPSEGIEYHVLDATDYEQLMQLGTHSFDAAVANMVLMDTPDIEPLFKALTTLLRPKGCFVFSISHPCFNSEEVEHLEDGLVIRSYHQTRIEKGEAIRKQPQLQYYFHRAISTYMQMGFKHGFVVDGLEEPVFDAADRGIYTKIPPILIMRMRLQG